MDEKKGVLESQHNSGRGLALFEFTEGTGVDSRLAGAEIRVQKAWARALNGVGVLTLAEVEILETLLGEALTLMKAGKFDWRKEDEDIHMNLERFISERAGSLGKKMHRGRSRNDLIATTLRLHVHDSVITLREATQRLALALCDRAELDAGILVPGLTHLQHGQPVRHGHVLLGHAWAFARDVVRMDTAAAGALSAMPLGSAALAGTTLPLDFRALADALGFDSVTLNSYDAVGDRDFVLQALDAFAQTAVHLSRLAEDCVIWSSTAMGLVKLPPAWSTGSSIMPNKRNPDVPELTRAKAAHIMGAASEAHLLMKSVPTSYGSDLHELKSVFLRSSDELSACLAVLPPFVRGLEVDPERAAELLNRGHLLATEIADELAAKGVPFREAYGQVAALIKIAEGRRCQVHELSEEDCRTVAPGLTGKFMEQLTPEWAVERRNGPGGTALARVHDGVRALREKLRTPRG